MWHGDSPLWQEDSPSWQEDSPSWQEDSPSWQEDSPSWQEDSPLGQGDSPLWQEDSPSWQGDSPFWSIVVHNIVHNQIPAELSELVPINENSPRLEIHKKLATKPTYLSKNQKTSSQFRNRAYNYNNLPGRITSLVDHAKFKKWTQIHILYPEKVPVDVNKIYMENQIYLQRLRN